ncbi:MAG: flavin reductase family protein [Victivallaceae bacterium]|nr:flavin reductase family protein [Victivallaceae bacterium]
MSNKKVWPGSTQLLPIPAVLVGCGNGREMKYNLLTVAWTGIVCSDPAMLSVSIRPERFSYALIKRSGEFTVNMPSRKIASALDYCGVVSGRDHDKFNECSLTARPGETVQAPIVAECPVSLECRVSKTLELGSHVMFVADILAVQVDESLISNKGALDVRQADPIAYAHGGYYGIGDFIGGFGFSVKKKDGAR